MVNTLIISIGNGGNNIADSMFDQTPDNMKILLTSIESDSLEHRKNQTLILKGDNEDFTFLRNELNAGIKNVFILSCLGRRSGSSRYVPQVVRFIQKYGANPIVIVTTPFDFEDSSVKQSAEETLVELQQLTDNILILKNNDLLSKNQNRGSIQTS